MPVLSYQPMPDQQNRPERFPQNSLSRQNKKDNAKQNLKMLIHRNTTQIKASLYEIFLLHREMHD